MMSLLEFDWLLSLATAAPTTPPAGGGGAEGTGTPPPGWFETLVSFVPLIAIVIFFYLLMIAPQRRKQKETQRMIESVEKGARVTTIGGMHGTVVNVTDTDIVLKVDETSNTKIRFQKSAIAGVEPRPGDEKK